MRPEIDYDFGPNTKVRYEPFALRFSSASAHEADALYEKAATVLDARNTLPRGEFTRFLSDARVNISLRMAEHLMNIARAEDCTALVAVGLTKAIQLLRATPEQRERLFAQHKIVQLSVAQLRALVDEALGKSRAAAKRKKVIPLDLVFAAGVLQLPLNDISAMSVETAFYTMSQIFGQVDNGNLMCNIAMARKVLLRYLGADAASVTAVTVASSAYVN